MISDAYKRLLVAYRKSEPLWGGAKRHAEPVAGLCMAWNLPRASILDFGCGLGWFAEELERIAPGRYTVASYDPGYPGRDVLPSGPFDVTVCTHVLEHVEPELLSATLDELHVRTSSFLYIEVPHGPATRTLPDGRNAHLIQRPAEWWRTQLAVAFGGWDIFQSRGANPANTVFVLKK